MRESSTSPAPARHDPGADVEDNAAEAPSAPLADPGPQQQAGTTLSASLRFAHAATSVSVRGPSLLVPALEPEGPDAPLVPAEPGGPAWPAGPGGPT